MIQCIFHYLCHIFPFCHRYVGISYTFCPVTSFSLPWTRYRSPIQLFRSLLYSHSLYLLSLFRSSSLRSHSHLVILHSCCRVLASALSGRHSCWWHGKMTQIYKTHKRFNKWAHNTAVQYNRKPQTKWQRPLTLSLKCTLKYIFVFCGIYIKHVKKLFSY